MLFNSISKLKQSKIFSLSIYALVFSFVLTIGGCTTTEIQRVKSESLPGRKGYKIIRLIMNDGTIINLENAKSRYFPEYKDRKNVIMYALGERTELAKDTFRISYHENIVDLKDVFSVTISREEIDGTGTAFAIAGVAILGAVIIIAATSGDDTPAYIPPSSYGGGQLMSCPFVYSFDGDTYVFDAEPYGGAISEGLKKTDYSKLENLKPAAGKYKLLMKNETDETQHTDEIKLLVVDHPLNTEVISDADGNMSILKNIYAPLSVIDENGKNIVSLVDKKDNVRWQTNTSRDISIAADKKMNHELIFKFPKPKDAKNVKLIINAGSSFWGGYMIKGMLNLYGDKVDELYSNLNSKGTEISRLYGFLGREEMYSLKVNVKENLDWIKRGEIFASTFLKFEDRIVSINIENVEEDYLEIKLDPPYGFWEIDRIGVAYDNEEVPVINEIPILTAIDENGNDISSLLNSTDGQYYDMPVLSNYAGIHFDNPPQKEGTTRTLYLKTTGYYDIHLKKDQPVQTELIEKMWNEPGFIINYSDSQYKEYLNTFSQMNVNEK